MSRKVKISRSETYTKSIHLLNVIGQKNEKNYIQLPLILNVMNGMIRQKNIFKGIDHQRTKCIAPMHI